MTEKTEIPQSPETVPESQPSLDSLFYPRSLLLIDGLNTERSVADLTLKNLSKNFTKGAVHRTTAQDFLQTETINNDIDLAIIIAEPTLEKAILQKCKAIGIKGLLAMDAFYREAGPLSRHGIEPYAPVTSSRLLGTQSFGIIMPHHNLNVTPIHTMPRPGTIALLSQSGTICTAVLDWGIRTGTAFSAIVSTGLMDDIDWHDLITWFGDDPYTKSIVIYMETIGDARGLLSAAREVALSKPLILLKAETTGDTSSAGNSLLDAALERVGVLRVSTIAELFYMANILATQPLPKGPRLLIFTNAAGPATMATDRLLTWGGKLAEVSPETQQELSEILPESYIHSNPVNLQGDASAHTYDQAIRAIGRDKNADGILVMLTPQHNTQPDKTAQKVVVATTRIGKPVLASWMGGERVAEGQAHLIQAGIPVFPYPDTPARLFALMWKQAQNLNSIYETPSVMDDEEATPTDPQSVSLILQGMMAEKRTELTEWESKAVLRAYGIPVVETLPASTEDEAITCANVLGYPVVLKIHSRVNALKRELNGVRLNLRTEQDIRDAFRSIYQSAVEAQALDDVLGVTVQPMVDTHGLELSAGTKSDLNFGPYIYLGTGGRMADIINDHAIGLPPLTTTLAQRIIEKTRIWQKLSSDKVITQDQAIPLQSLLVRIGQLIVHHPQIKDMEINPILITTSGIVCLDARISLYSTEELPTCPRPAIRPYPNQYTWKEKTRNGSDLLLRPVRPEDEPLIVEFHKTLSEETIYRRYFFQQKLSRRTSHERLRRTCFLDFDREIALAAIVETEQKIKEITAVGRLARDRNGDTAELAMVVSDHHQGQGIGSLMLKHLMDIAKAEGIRKITGTMLPGNIHMQHLFSRAGFDIHSHGRESVSVELIVS